MFTPGATQPGFTPLTVRVNVANSIGLVVDQSSGACGVTNSGTAWAAMDLGGANATSQDATLTTCAAYVKGKTFTLSTSFSVNANTCTGTCTTWKLSAALGSTPPNGVSIKFDNTNMTTTAATLQPKLSYSTDNSYPLVFTVVTNGSSGATSGAVQCELDLTATANGVSGVTASAKLELQFIYEPGISISFVQDASGVAMSGGGFAAALDFGTISAYGALPSGVSRPALSSSSFTARTPIDIDVEKSGVTSSNYTLQADLASAAPTGIQYAVNGVTLSTAPTLSTVTTTGTYDTNQAYNLDVIVSTSASGQGGPAINSPLSDTLNFTATAN
jgi:hypothetical protein